MYQSVFQRYEKKYIIGPEQYEALMGRLKGKVERDEYGEYTIFNLYYDTGRYDLIRASAGKPVYKEKLRLRSYGKAGAASPVFLELKKKYLGVVYKRRLRLPYAEAAGFIAGGLRKQGDTGDPVLREIRCFMDRYPGLSPKVFLAYDRTAFVSPVGKGEGLRVTFDTNIRFRRNDLHLDREAWGTDILGPGKVLLELKTPGVIPLWLCRALSDCGAFPVSFSKYGTCYQRFLLGNENMETWEESTSA